MLIRLQSSWMGDPVQGSALCFGLKQHSFDDSYEKKIAFILDFLRKTSQYCGCCLCHYAIVCWNLGEAFLCPFWRQENKYHKDCIVPGVCEMSQNILLLQIHKYSNLQGKKYNGLKIPLELPWLPWGRCSWGQIRKATKYQITFKRSPVGSKWTERSLVWDELLWWKTNSKVRWWFCWSIFCTHTQQ